MNNHETLGFQWHLTNRCHGKCLHCYGDKFDASGETTTSEAKLILDRLTECCGKDSLVPALTGGEFFMMPHFSSILDLIEAHPGVKNYSIITSGVCNSGTIDSDTADRLSRSERLSDIRLSIEAGEEALNDSLRWSGSFKTVLKAGRTLLEKGISVNLMITLSNVNFEQIIPLIDLAQNKGFSGIIFERYVPLGKSILPTQNTAQEETNLKLLPVTGQEWLFAIKDLIYHTGFDSNIENLSPYRAFWLKFKANGNMDLTGALCNLGQKSMALMPGGTVYPCRRLTLDSGNVLEESIDKILSRLKSYSSEVMKPGLKGPICLNCHHDCSGCRALALAKTGDITSDDSSCWNAKE